MSSRITITLTSDVEEAISIILSREPMQTSKNYAISKSVIEYAKVVARDIERTLARQNAPKDEPVRKWAKKGYEPVDNDYSDS